jgi:hypothetical protein
MPGKAYNPKLFEQERQHHEKFNGLPQEAIDTYRSVSKEGVAKKGFPAKWTYEKLWDMRKAGRSGQVGHFIYEMFYDIYMGVEDELRPPRPRCAPLSARITFSPLWDRLGPLNNG